MKQRGAVSLHLVLTVFLAIGMVTFGVLAVLAYRDNEYVRTNLDQLVVKAEEEAAAAQKNKDDEEYRKANQLPYRTYVADSVDGSFELQIPKNWSLYVARNINSSTQLDLASSPNVVVDDRGSKAVNTHAFRLQIIRKSQQTVIRDYAEEIKKKQVTSKGVTVSGIDGTWLEGTIDSQRHNGVVVILPVRDKTFVISTEDRNYLEEFNKILESAKINP